MFGWMTEQNYEMIVGVGSAIVDIFSEVEDSVLVDLSLEKGTMSLISREVSIEVAEHIESLNEQGGGSVANTMVGIARLGVPSKMVARVEEDVLGLVFEGELKFAGVELNPFYVPLSDPLGTGRCFVMVTPDAERTMLTYLGASAGIGELEMSTLLTSPPPVTYLESYLLDCPDMFAPLCDLAAKSSAIGRQVAVSLSDPELVKRHRSRLMELIDSGVSVVFANAEEAANLTDSGDPTFAAAMLGERGISGAITLGPEGALGFDQNQMIRLPAHPTDLVDTTGAGDQFAAGWLAGLAKGFDLEKRTSLGLLCAAEVVSHFGARPQVDILELAKKQGLA